MFFMSKKLSNAYIRGKKTRIPYVQVKMSQERKNKFHLSRGVAVRVLDNICLHVISAVLRPTDLRSKLPFVIKAGLMHFILRILKSLKQLQGLQVAKNVKSVLKIL
jgi:hypothetical protein